MKVIHYELMKEDEIAREHPHQALKDQHQRCSRMDLNAK
jgi:hypothetical protein